MNAQGAWRSGDTTRARITPVCGGKAILEEWAGTLHGSFMNGFSLRAYDPVRKDWDLLLFWTTDGNGGFGRLRGTFRHGRGEFFDRTDGLARTRYSFSDGLSNSVRWDSATTIDGGIAWKTDWIMEFSRTRAAAAVTQDALFESEWTTGTVSPHAEARQLDGLLGVWAGTQITPEGDELEARLRCKRLNKDCLILDLLETRAPGSRDWDERLTVRGFESRTASWAAWTVTEQDSTLRPSKGTLQGATMEFAREPEGGTRIMEWIDLSAADEIQIVQAIEQPDGTTSTTVTTLRPATR